MKPPKFVTVSRMEVLVPSNKPFQRDLRHVTGVVPRKWTKQRFTFNDPKFKDVKLRDRIKWWNIVPGDSVRIRGDPDSTIHRVSATNKFTNRVFLQKENVRRVSCFPAGYRT